MFKGRQFDQSVILLFMRWYLAYNLSPRDLEEMMAERGIAVDHVEQTIGAEPATRWVAAHLQVEPGSPLLRVERVVFAQSGMPIEWSVALFPDDRHQYRTDLQAR